MTTLKTKERQTIRYHQSDLSREYLLAKCPCRQIVRIPVEGCVCLCGIRHVRKEELPGKVRERLIEAER